MQGKIIIVEGTKMKSGFFPRKDEVVLSTMTAVVVMALVHFGFSSLVKGDSDHSIFRKSTAGTISKR